MPKIMEPDTLQFGAPNYGAPRSVKVRARFFRLFVVADAGKDMRASAWMLAEDLESWRRQDYWSAARLSLDEKNAPLEIHISPP